MLPNKFFHDKRLAVFDMIVLQGFEFRSVEPETEYFGHADERCCVPESDVMRGLFRVWMSSHLNMNASLFGSSAGLQGVCLCLYEVYDSGNVLNAESDCLSENHLIITDLGEAPIQAP